MRTLPAGLFIVFVACGTPDPNQTCAQSQCACNQGFTKSASTGTCVDIDECATAGACDGNANCNNNAGSFSCTCRKGFSGDGHTCTDIDECTTDNGGCGLNADCTNQPGDHACACKKGFDGPKGACVDIDECAVNDGGCTAANTHCVNAAGTFSCDCVSGYAATTAGCVDVDECATNNGGCGAGSTCLNLPGTAQCPCNAGFVEALGACTPGWTSVSPIAAGGAMAYDANRQRTVLFASGGNGGRVSSELWELDGTSWVRRLERGPSARVDATVVYDSARKKILVFGGMDQTGEYLHDLWEWDGLAWKQLASAPSTLLSGGLGTYDTARHRLVVAAWLSTWEWDASTGWVEGPKPLSDMSIHNRVIAFDEKRSVSVMVIFDTVYLGTPGPVSTYEYDGTAWKKLAITGPTRREDATMTYDASRRTILLHGGTEPQTIKTLKDTWELDGTSWVHIADSSPELGHPSLAYDVPHQRALLLTTNGQSRTWAFDSVLKQWAPLPLGAPASHYLGGLAYDAKRDKVVLFGGQDTIAFDPSPDTWEFDGARWAKSSAAPVSLFQTSQLAYDSVREAVVVLGKTKITDTALNTYAFNGVSWSLQSASTVTSSRMMTFDRVALKPLVYAQPTSWRLNQTVWQSLDSTGPQVIDGAIAHDSIRNRVIVFGGRNSAFVTLGDTWEWNGTLWAKKSSTGPTGATNLGATPTASGAMVVLSARKTWSWDGTVWTELTQPIPTAPYSASAMTYDAQKKRLYAYDGTDLWIRAMP